jgi:hypothetical protein
MKRGPLNFILHWTRNQRKKILITGLFVLLCFHHESLIGNNEESKIVTEAQQTPKTSGFDSYPLVSIGYNERYGISGECSEYIFWTFLCASNVTMDAWIVDSDNWQKLRNFNEFEGKHVASGTPRGDGITGIDPPGKWYFVVIHTDEANRLVPALVTITLNFVGEIETTPTTTPPTTYTTSQTTSSPSSSSPSSSDGTWLIIVIPIVVGLYIYSKVSKKKEKHYISPRPAQNLKPFPNSYYEEQRQLKLRIMERERARANHQKYEMDSFLRDLDQDFEDWERNEKRGGKKL